ncbi:hypothetical protein BDN71DRAFT_1429949 [Pleurotus eryngii]|uniref:Uncharacterized protein n=1 Tax=Pleurotus eryngii TaxID=5323 RepID=A0A9P6A102_PLEER|nr:hypothetical protein BDN71DRAFT_1429949 [Pleurotus eryngii]
MANNTNHLSATDSARVAELKAEGNAFYLQKNLEAAAKKYSKALEIDDTNAVIYCNRAACRLGQSRFVDACDDARKALDEPADSSIHWERAVNLMPNENLSAAEVKQRAAYFQSLEAARRKKGQVLVDGKSLINLKKEQTEHLPWELAAAMIPELREAQNPNSSAWVIFAACEDFREGIKNMKLLRPVKTYTGGTEATMFFGHFGVLTCLSNGLLRDRRIFHMNDDKFLDYYNQQVMFEAQNSQAWMSETPVEILRLARERLASEGWNKVRPALSVSVRGRFLRGFIQAGLTKRPDIALQFIGHAIEIIELCKKEWPDVPDSDRGAIFQTTFLLGLRAEWLEQYFSAYNGVNGQFTLETLEKEADRLIADLNAVLPHQLPQNVDPGFILSFYSYPMGHAYAAKAFCRSQMAKRANQRNDYQDWLKYTQEAGASYLQAAQRYMKDDENHLWFMKCSLDCSLSLGQPLSMVLPPMCMIREAYPKMQRIWGNSASAMQGRDEAIKSVFRTEDRLKELLDQGIVSMSDPFDTYRLAQSRIVDALEDAKKAVQLDPQYIKAHARVATAMDAMGFPGVASWERAIELMPSENLSPTEAKQRQSYVDSLEASKLMEKKGRSARTSGGTGHQHASPVAGAVNNPYSSAWVIYAAHKEFHSGMEILKNLQSVPNSSKTYLVEGKTGALTNLSNGILSDSRVFMVDDPIFFRKLHQPGYAISLPVKLEGMHTKAWLLGSPEEVIRNARECLRSESWDTVPSRSVCQCAMDLLRTRFLQGFLHGGFHGCPDMATEYIGHAIEIIKLGRRVWSNVSDSEKGAVFRETFLMGLRAEWLDQYLKMLKNNVAYFNYHPAQALDTGECPLATLDEEADSLITNLKESWPRFPKDGNDPGFIYSFHYYPLGTAYAVIWLVSCTSDQYPPDKEYSIWYMKCALASMVGVRSPLSLILPIMQKGGRDKQIEELLKTEKKLRELVMEDVVSMNDTFNTSLL